MTIEELSEKFLDVFRTQGVDASIEFWAANAPPGMLPPYPPPIGTPKKPRTPKPEPQEHIEPFATEHAGEHVGVTQELGQK